MASDPKQSSNPPGLGEVGADIGQREARQAVTTGHVRWILRISLALTIVALAVVGSWYATRSPRPYPPRPAAGSALR